MNVLFRKFKKKLKEKQFWIIGDGKVRNFIESIGEFYIHIVHEEI